MERHTCISCRKKRYKKYMVKVPILKTKANYYHNENHWVCKECTPILISRLSDQVRQLNKTIQKLLSTPVDN